LPFNAQFSASFHLCIMEDSEEYSEEFESDFEDDPEAGEEEQEDSAGGSLSRPATPPDLMLDQARLFSRLLAGLEAGLGGGLKLNYAQQPLSKRIALGVFLTKLPGAREDFARRIHLEYAHKKEETRLRLQQLLSQSQLQPRDILGRFNDHIKALAAAGAMESDLFNYKEEQLMAQTMEEMKKFVLTAVADLEKQVRVSAHFIRQGHTSNFKRAEELQDEFLWRRFVHRVQSLARNKVLVNEPQSSIKSDIKRVIEEKLEVKILLKNVLMLEDHEFSEVSAARQSSSERKTAISKLCIYHIDTSPQHIDKVLTKFLTLQHSSKPSDQPTPKNSGEKPTKRPAASGFPLHTCLSRSCESYIVIASLQPVKWSPVTLLIYEAGKEINRLFDQEKQILVAEESTSFSTAGVAEIQELEVSGTHVRGLIDSTPIELHVATVKALTSLSGTVGLAGLVEAVEGLYGVQTVGQGKGLYVLETLSGFQAVGQKEEGRYVRRLSLAELEELCRFYLLKVHVQHIPRDLFPDSSSDQPCLKYSYVLIRDLIALRSGNFCRNWLLQLKPAPPRPASVGPILGPRICKWVGCLAQALEETEQSALQETMEAMFRGSLSGPDSRKAKKKRKSHSNDPSFAKKPLAPIRKSKNSMLEPSTAGFLCDFHYRLRHFMKANSMLLSPFLEDSSLEVWKAVQAGMRWQLELSTKVRLGPLCSGSAKQALTAYFQHAVQCLSVSGRERRFAPRVRHSEDLYEQHRERLTDTLSDLRVKRDTEVAFTNELRELLVSSQGSSALSALGNLLSEAASAGVAVKLAKLRAIRDRMRDVSNSTFGDFTEIKGVVPSSRPQSHNLQSERGKDPSPEHQRRLEEVQHRKIYTSPYGDRLYKPGRIARPKLPPKAPAKPVDSQQSSRKKISMLNMD